MNLAARSMLFTNHDNTVSLMTRCRVPTEGAGRVVVLVARVKKLILASMILTSLASECDKPCSIEPDTKIWKSISNKDASIGGKLTP